MESHSHSHSHGQPNLALCARQRRKQQWHIKAQKNARTVGDFRMRHALMTTGNNNSTDLPHTLTCSAPNQPITITMNHALDGRGDRGIIAGEKCNHGQRQRGHRQQKLGREWQRYQLNHTTGARASHGKSSRPHFTPMAGSTIPTCVHCPRRGQDRGLARLRKGEPASGTGERGAPPCVLLIHAAFPH